MLELQAEHQYKIIYGDGSERKFRVLHASPAKFLIRVTTDNVNNIPFVDLLAAQQWSDIIEINTASSQK